MAIFQVQQPNFQQQQPTTARKQQPTTARKSPLELMIMQQAMAQNADAKTLAGFAFGKLLRGLFDDWKERYDARDILNYLRGQSENEQNEFLARIEQNNPRQYQRMQEYLAENNGKWNGWNNLPQVQTTTLPTQTPTIQSAKPAPQINTDWLKTDNKPWENPDNWGNLAGLNNTKKLLGDSDSLMQRATLTDEPFKLTGDNDYFNPRQWTNFDDALKSLRRRW